MFKHNGRSRFLVLPAILVLVALVVSACAPQAAAPTTAPAAPAQTEAPAAPEAPAEEPAAPEAPAATGATGEVTLWTEFTAGGEATGIQQLIDSFNGQNTGVTINHRPIGNEEFFTVVRTGLSGGTPPDLLQYEGYQQTRDFAGAGQLTDLTDWWEANKDRFELQDAGEHACMVDGRMYCIPMSMSSGWQVYYNPEMLEENNIEVPTTWEEFTAALDTLKEAGIIPVSLGNRNGWPGEHWWMNFIVQRCGVDTIYDAINMENDVKFTDECFVQGAADLRNMAEQGYFPPGVASDDYGAAQAIFVSRQAPFFQTGSWYAGGWEEQGADFELGIMPFPAFSDNPNPNNISAAVIHTLAIPENAANKEGAMQVLDYFFSDEGAAMWAAAGPLSMVAGAVENNSTPELQEIWQSIANAEAALPWIENELPPGVGEDRIYNGTVGLVSLTMTPEEFTQSIQEALEAAR